MTVPVRCYRSVVEKGLKKTLGGADTMTGTTPAAITHSIAVLGFGATQLPAVHAQMVRDDLNQKMSGAAFQRATFNFPLDGEGTAEFELWGLYQAHDAAAPPAVSFTGLSEDPMMLRDAQMFIDGSMTAVPDLMGFEFAFVNNLQRKWYAKRNVVTQTLGTPTQTRKLWFPAENKLGASQDVTFGVSFGNVNTVQELANDYGQVEKFVFEVLGSPLATTPPSTELLRFTIYNGLYTGGGAEALSARDDITASFEGGAFWSDADSADIKVEITNSSNVAIT